MRHARDTDTQPTLRATTGRIYALSVGDAAQAEKRLFLGHNAQVPTAVVKFGCLRNDND